jgi:hypothetical protein
MSSNVTCVSFSFSEQLSLSLDEQEGFRCPLIANAKGHSPIRHNLVTIWPLCMRKSNLPAQESLAVAVSALFVSNVCMTSGI